MIKAIVFDVDGVLIKREKYFSERYAEEFGVPLDNLLPFFKNEFDECLTGKRDLKKEVEKRLTEWRWKGNVDELLRYWFSHEDAVDMQIIRSVKELRKKGIKCYLGTNNDPYRTKYLLDKVGLRNYFDDVFSSAYIGFTKPHPEFWQSVYKKLAKLRKEEILVWDDDKDNVASALEFGITAKQYRNFEDYKRVMTEFI